MRLSTLPILIMLTAGPLWLFGCTAAKRDATQATLRESAAEDAKLEAPSPATADPQATGSTPVPLGPPPPGVSPRPEKQSARTLGGDPNDDLNLGKKYFRACSFGIAEQHFRKAVEGAPRDAEAWTGLAAAYDRLKRFDLADRAYNQAMAIVGPTPEILNNHGYSYMLRADYARAREKFLAAQAKDPTNPYIRNNLELLEESARMGKAAQ
jgi:tetratricopeptide (TPR) repeat protein